MLAEPEPAEELLEVLLLVAVVVALHHADEERLAEPPRTDEEDERVALLKLREVLGLVNVIPPLVADPLEIRNAVGYLQVRSLRHAPYYTKIPTPEDTGSIRQGASLNFKLPSPCPSLPTADALA